MSGRIGPARGFTLIEMLLATALLAIGMALAFAALRSAMASVERAQGLADRTDEVRAVQRFLRRQLGAARPIQWLPPDASSEDERKALIGEPERIRFAAPMPGYLSFGGPYLQTLRLERGEQGLRLVFEHAMLAGEQVLDDVGRPPQPLLEGIADARFSYRGLDSQGELVDWQDRWDEVSWMPLLVRLELRMADERTHWPPFELELPLAFGAQPAAGNAPRTPSLRPSSPPRGTGAARATATGPGR